MKSLPELIQPMYHQAITDSFRFAFSNVASLTLTKSGYTYSKRSHSSLMHDSMICELKKRLLPLGGVKFRERRGLCTFIFEGTRACLRVKKVNKYNRISSSNTNQSRLFELQLPLFPEFESYNLTLGYQVDNTYEINVIFHNPSGANIVHNIPLVAYNNPNIEDSSIVNNVSEQKIQNFELKHKNQASRKKASGE